jgi:hypothetical protein
VQKFVDTLKAEIPEGTDWILGGSWRRKAPEIGDLDVMIVTETGLFGDFKFPEHFVVDEDGKQGPQVAQGNLVLHHVAVAGRYEEDVYESIHVDFWCCTPAQRGAFLMFITGPMPLNIQQRRIAKEKGYMLSQYGLFDHDGVQLDRGTEIDIYSLLGLPWLRPEDRQQFAKNKQVKIKKFTIEERSDSDPNTKYAVQFWYEDDELKWYCPCPAYKYSKKLPAECKHTQRAVVKFLTARKKVLEAHAAKVASES